MKIKSPTWNIIKFDELDSTNDYAKQLALSGYFEGTIVTAAKQNKGKGRRGRDWISPLGNLYCSLVLNVENKIENMGQLSFVASTALADAINEKTSDLKVLCKWPNDIITSDYKKIAGILIETTGVSANDFAILGVGVNVLNYPLDMVSNIRASSLLEQGVEITADDLLSLLLKHFETKLALWRERGFKIIREEWLKNAYGLGKEIEIRLPQNTFKGIFKDIDDNGAILFENDEGKIQKINSGEVFFNNNNN